MHKFPMTALVVGMVAVQLSGSQTFAVALEEKGNKPLIEVNYSELPGIMPVLNSKARVYLLWVLSHLGTLHGTP